MADIHVRCSWCGKDKAYQNYHDLEWGVPCRDDKKLFEFLILESAQAGLSWLTILRKRDNYRLAFANFDVKAVSTFGDQEKQRLMQDSGIVRNRLKIESAITNAQCFYTCFAFVIESRIDGTCIFIIRSMDVGKNSCCIFSRPADGPHFVEAPTQCHGTASADAAKGGPQPCCPASMAWRDDGSMGFCTNGKRHQSGHSG